MYIFYRSNNVLVNLTVISHLTTRLLKQYATKYIIRTIAIPEKIKFWFSNKVIQGIFCSDSKTVSGFKYTSQEFIPTFSTKTTKPFNFTCKYIVCTFFFSFYFIFFCNFIRWTKQDLPIIKLCVCIFKGRMLPQDQQRARISLQMIFNRRYQVITSDMNIMDSKTTISWSILRNDILSKKYNFWTWYKTQK